MQKQYKYLLFDLDDTLVDDYESRAYAFEQILKYKNEKVSKEKIDDFIKIDNQFWKDRAVGKIKVPYEIETKEEQTIWLRAQRFIEYFKNMSLEEAIKMNEKYV